MASVDEVDAEEMQNQTAEDIIRKSSVLRVRYMPDVNCRVLSDTFRVIWIRSRPCFEGWSEFSSWQ